MSCTRPLKASFDEAGQISFSKRKWSKEFVPFEFPCRKCIFCRLETAREKAVRCIHHAQFFPQKSIFLTLTYRPEDLTSSRLQYSDWQDFMKALRNFQGSSIEDRISFMVTGEYGEKNKRPHWHAILFNFRPPDEKVDRETELGDTVYTSKLIDDLWDKGKTEYGEVTFQSAGYVGRYAAKKLVHGHDQDHDFHPKHKTSSRIPIGLPWIQKYWQQTFSNGYVVLPNGKVTGIPRYYEDWFRKNHTQAWLDYASTVKIEQQKKARASREKENEIFESNLIYASPWAYPLSRNEVKEIIQEKKHEDVLKGLKL